MPDRTSLAIAIIVAAALLILFLISPIGVLVNGLLIGSEENIDFIPGANMGITAVADPTSDVVRVTFTSTATGTATSTGDVTDVGPGCSTGPCLTDSATTTGGTILVWEGATDDGFEITFTATADPATSSVYHFEAVADHEWSPITGDFTIGDADEGQIRLGSLTIGKANDTVSTTVTDGIAFFYNDATALVEDISFIFLGPAGIPRFVLAVEGPDLATYNPRSMLIGPAASFANVDDNVICSTNFNDIDCDTGATGADLGVQDDIEVGGSVFLSFDCTGNTNGGALTIATTTGLVSCTDDDVSAASTSTRFDLLNDVNVSATSTADIVLADGQWTNVQVSGDATLAVSGALMVGTSTRFRADPADCASDTFATAIDPVGDLTCGSISVEDADVEVVANLGTLDFQDCHGVVDEGGEARIDLQCNKTQLEGAISDIDDFAEADGDIFTGVHDFGGASIEIENSLGCGVAIDGEICINTAATSSALIFQSNTTHVLVSTSSKGIFYENATSTDDFSIWRFDRAATLTKVCYLAEGGTNWIGQLQEYDSNGDSPSDTQASDTTALAGINKCNTSFSNAVIDAGDWIGPKTTSVSGTNTNMRITWYFKWER